MAVLIGEKLQNWSDVIFYFHFQSRMPWLLLSSYVRWSAFLAGLSHFFRCCPVSIWNDCLCFVIYFDLRQFSSSCICYFSLVFFSIILLFYSYYFLLFHCNFHTNFNGLEYSSCKICTAFRISSRSILYWSDDVCFS